MGTKKPTTPAVGSWKPEETGFPWGTAPTAP